jgi:hypothetical protein
MPYICPFFMEVWPNVVYMHNNDCRMPLAWNNTFLYTRTPPTKPCWQAANNPTFKRRVTSAGHKEWEAGKPCRIGRPDQRKNQHNATQTTQLYFEYFLFWTQQRTIIWTPLIPKHGAPPLALALVHQRHQSLVDRIMKIQAFGMPSDVSRCSCSMRPIVAQRV